MTINMALSNDQISNLSGQLTDLKKTVKELQDENKMSEQFVATKKLDWEKKEQLLQKQFELLQNRSEFNISGNHSMTGSETEKNMRQVLYIFQYNI